MCSCGCLDIFRPLSTNLHASDKERQNSAQRGCPRAIVLSITQANKKGKLKKDFLMFCWSSCFGSSVLIQVASAGESTSEISVEKGGWGFAEMLMNESEIRHVVSVYKQTTGNNRRYREMSKSRRGEGLNCNSILQSKICKERCIYF